MNFRMSFFMPVLFFSMSCASLQVSGQSRSIPDFSSPLEIPLLLSGNYGEVRSAHFHAGIDIKTEQVEGKKVLSAEDGYVVRINVQTGGYGNAIYLAHPGGFVTAYCHLKEFTPEITQYVKDNQYKRKSFEVDLFPEANRFVFKKGEWIGYSGNSGNSAGPHLHFEIRDQRNSIPLNALYYNLPIRDDISPKIECIAIYPLDENSTVNGKREKAILPVMLRNGKTVLKEEEMPQVSGNIGFGIETYDFLNGAANRCSPYTISFSMDESPICFFRLDSIPFNMTSYVDSHIDYEEKMRSGKVIQKLFIDPNNHLGIYKILINKGVINFGDSIVHRAQIVVKDVYGNACLLAFSLQAMPAVKEYDALPVNSTVVAEFGYNKLNVYENEDVRVVVPENALYNNIHFQYDRITALPQSISDTFCIHNEYTPLHASYILSIRPGNLTEELRDKVLIASRDEDGRLISYGGTYSDGYVTASMGSFGRFYLALDTISPQISPVSFSEDRNYTEGQILSFRITDHESGISSYSGYIDGKWALFAYDAKQDLITYSIDKDRLVKGQVHQFEIFVTDNKDNFSHFLSSFYY